VRVSLYVLKKTCVKADFLNILYMLYSCIAYIFYQEIKIIKNFKTVLCAFFLAGATLCVNAGTPLVVSMAYIQKHKAAAQKHEAIILLLESRAPELATGFLDATEWMLDHAKPTKAEKQQGKDFIAALNVSSKLTKKEKARVRGFVNRSIGVWSGGKIAGVTIGSVVGLMLLANGIKTALPIWKAAVNQLKGVCHVPEPSAVNRQTGDLANLELSRRGGALQSGTAHILAPAGVGAVGGAGGSASGASTVAPIELFFIHNLTGELAQLTRENFANQDVMPSTGRPAVLFRDFLRCNTNLVFQLDAIRCVVFKQKAYVLCSAKGVLSAYEFEQPYRYVNFDTFVENVRVEKRGACQFNAIFGQEAIQRLAQDNGIQRVGGAGGSAGVGTGSGAADSASAVGEDQATQYDVEEQLPDTQNPSFLITVKAVAVQETRVTCPIKEFGMDIFLSDRNPSKLIIAFLSRHEDLRQNLIAVRCLHSRQQLYFLCFMDDEKIKVYRWRRSAELPFDSDEQAFELVVRNRHALDNIGFQMIRKIKSSGK